MIEAGDSAGQAKAGWAEIFTGRYGIYTLVLNLGVALFAINQFVVATIMPSIVTDLGGLDYYTWAFSLFAVGSIIGAASAGPLRDAVGVRRAYIGAGIVLGIGLVGSALATDMPGFVAWRLIQGIGGGALASHAYGLVATNFPERLRGHALSVISTIWGVATVAGPGFGALFADVGAWRGAFWSLAPLMVVFACLAWRFIDGDRGHGQLSRIPYTRLTLLAIAVLLLSATSLTRKPGVQAVLVVAAFAVAWAAFVRDARAERNIFPRQVTALATDLGATYWIFFLVSVVMAFTNTYTTFYLQVLHGLAPLTAGYLFAIQSFMWTVSALLVVNVRTGLVIPVIIAGLVLLMLAAIAIALTVEAGPVAVIAVALAVSGAGIGLLNNPAIQHIMAVAPKAESQIAGTSVQAVRNLGISFGAAAAGTVAATAGLVDGAPRATVAFAMERLFAVNVLFALAALAIAIAMRARGRKS